MSKRFQIPATPKDQKLFQSAARRSGLSAAEWARRLLRREAEFVLKAKSWDQLFTDIHSLADSGEWEVPKRDSARPVENSED
jgi:hypothetical protein